MADILVVDDEADIRELVMNGTCNYILTEMHHVTISSLPVFPDGSARPVFSPE